MAKFATRNRVYSNHISFYRFKVHRNGNASEVLKSIAHMDNSNKQCKLIRTVSYSYTCYFSCYASY